MPENTDTCEEAQKRRDAEWEALMRLKKQGRWENRADAAKGIKSAVIQTVGWALASLSLLLHADDH